MNRSPYVLLPCAALLAAAVPAAAQRPPVPADSLPAYVVEGIVVTSRRAPELRLEVAQSIQVITRTELDRTPAMDFADALKKNEPVDVIQYPGLLAGVGIRGFRPQISGINPRTLVLIDGRPSGVSNLATLDPAIVERVEVVRGPASSLYGSSAMGGVVNVITRSSTGPVSGRAIGRYGSFGTYRGEIGLGGQVLPAVDFDFAFAAAGQTAGYRVGAGSLTGAESVTKTLASGATVQLPELTPDTVLTYSRYDARSGHARLGYAVTSDWRVDLRGEAFVADRVQSPGDLTATFDSRTLKDLARRSGEVAVTGGAGRHALLFRAFGARDDARYYSLYAENPFVNFRSPNLFRGAQVQDVVSWGAHSLATGFDYTAASARSQAFVAEGVEGAPYNADSRITSWGPFADARLTGLNGALSANFGARLDRIGFGVEEARLADASRVSPNHESHTVFTPSGGLLYRPGAGVRLHAAAGRAFVTPGAFQIAGYSENAAGTGVMVTRGNPDLDAESSVSWDLGAGIARPARGLEADVTYFHTDVRDRIAMRMVPVEPGALTPGGDPITSIATYENVDEARIRGLEARASYDFGAATGFRRSVRLFGSATRLLTAEETAAGETVWIKNVASTTAVFGLSYDDLTRFDARLSGRYVGRRSDTDWSDWFNPGDLRYPAFLVFDATVSARFTDRYGLALMVGNLLDENYYEVRGYNMPGRTIQFQLGVDF
jgi:vitamin B12 transporter